MTALKSCLRVAWLCLPLIAFDSVAAQPVATLDLATVSPQDGIVRRIYGSQGMGAFGVPVAGGADCDGDGHLDYAAAFFTASPLGRVQAGEVDLVFGDGRLDGFVDTAVDGPDLLRIIGSGLLETAGVEIWMDDVTGDGLGDLLIGRQNFSPDTNRIGAGALTLVVGSPALRAHAGQGFVDLRTPPGDLAVTTFVGRRALDRLGIWMRTGDVTGDGIADVVVGADQEDSAPPLPLNEGAVYVIRGGEHLASGGVIDLASFGSTALAGHIAKVTGPPEAIEYHLGATCQIADLDGNGRAEVLAAATLNRHSALIAPLGAPPGSAVGFGGSDDGSLYILWDENFSGNPWPPGYTFAVSSSPGARTVIHGGGPEESFAEEIVAGLDFDADGKADLFAGDLYADGTPGLERPFSGTGYVFYGVTDLKGLEFHLDDPPEELRLTRILGPTEGALGGDTAAHGDFNGDGIADLAFTSPHATALGRRTAGTVHVLYGRPGGWPELVDTRPENMPPESEVRIAEIQGAAGTSGEDIGDTLGYSAAAADLDGDGKTDLIVNEMLGNGLGPGTIDVGNVVLIGGAGLPVEGGGGDGQEDCEASATRLCLRQNRFRVEVDWRDFEGDVGAGRVVGYQASDSGLFWFFDPENWELMVKVLDGCGFNDRFWVFASASTNVEYTLRVTDTATGDTKSYFNPLGTLAPAVADTGALATCGD